MNQIESLYQPSFNSHSYGVHSQQALYPGPSPRQQQHSSFPPPSPVAPSTPSSLTSHAAAPPPHLTSPSFGNGSSGAPGNVDPAQPSHEAQRQQSPFSIAQHQSRSTPFTSAGHPQSIPAPALSPLKQSTPPSSLSGSASPQKYPMAAPPLPASVQRQQSPHTASNASTSQPSSPSATAHAAREKERVGLLLDINVELLREMSQLQAEGKGGATTPQQAALLKSQGLSDKPAADEYIQVCLRLQANLSYLYSQPDMQALNPHNHNQPMNKKGPPHPPLYVRPPPTLPQLEGQYAALRRLFPGWAGKDAAPTTS